MGIRLLAEPAWTRLTSRPQLPRCSPECFSPTMRWSIRYQLLLPLLTLLIGVAGISTWTAVASATRARQQIEMQVRQVARTLSESRFPLTQTVLEQRKG